MTKLARDASLTSTVVGETFGRNLHDSKFKPQLRSRSQLQEINKTVQNPNMRRHEYHDRDLSAVYTKVNKKKVNKVTYGRPPQLESPEIQKMLE